MNLKADFGVFSGMQVGPRTTEVSFKVDSHIFRLNILLKYHVYVIYLSYKHYYKS